MNGGDDKKTGQPRSVRKEKPTVVALEPVSASYKRAVGNSVDILDLFLETDPRATERAAAVSIATAGRNTILKDGPLDRLPKLGLIAFIVDLPADFDLMPAIKRGIRVTHVPPFTVPNLAPLALSLYDSVRRNALTGGAVGAARAPGALGLQSLLDDPVNLSLLPSVFDGVYETATQGLATGRESEVAKSTHLPSLFEGKRVGIVGLGRDGTTLARLLSEQGVAAMFFDTVERSSAKIPRAKSLSTLARRSDVLFVTSTPEWAAVPGLRPRFHDGIYRELGPTGHLISVDTGAVVRRPELTAAVAAGLIAGAAIGTRTGAISQAEWLRLGNVLVREHFSAIDEELEEGIRFNVFFRNVLSFHYGGTLQFELT